MLSLNLKMTMRRLLKKTLAVVIAAASLAGCSIRSSEDERASELSIDEFVQALEDAGCKYTSHDHITGATATLLGGHFSEYSAYVICEPGEEHLYDPILVRMKMIKFNSEHDASVAYDYVYGFLTSEVRSSVYGNTAVTDELDEDGWCYYMLMANTDGLMQDPLSEDGNYIYYALYYSVDTVMLVEVYFEDCTYEETDADRVLAAMNLPNPSDLNDMT